VAMGLNAVNASTLSPTRYTGPESRCSENLPSIGTPLQQGQGPEYWTAFQVPEAWTVGPKGQTTSYSSLSSVPVSLCSHPQLTGASESGELLKTAGVWPWGDDQNPD
jgi:hypothetical protein